MRNAWMHKSVAMIYAMSVKKSLKLKETWDTIELYIFIILYDWFENERMEIDDHKQKLAIQPFTMTMKNAENQVELNDIMQW